MSPAARRTRDEMGKAKYARSFIIFSISRAYLSDTEPKPETLNPNVSI